MSPTIFLVVIHRLDSKENYNPKNVNYILQSEPEFRPLMSEVVQDLLDMIRREPQGSGSSED